jgi:fermentation-respiration switch protein FrsA (DUF1100 family)
MVEVKRIIIETGRVQDIPVMTMVLENAERCPVVLFAHRFTGAKEDGLALGYRLAARGFLFLSLDARSHGERLDERMTSVGEPWEGDIYPHQSGLDTYLLMHELIVETATDIDRLIEHLGSDRRADAGRIGLTGFSMGGFLTFYVAALCPAIQAAVPMAGLPAFTARWEDVVLESSSYKEWAEQMAAVQAETTRWTGFMREIDPFDRMKGFYPRALMMINGDRDLDSPKKYLVDLYRALKPLYADLSGRLRLNIHNDAGHELTPAMMEDVCDWFTEHPFADQTGSVSKTRPISGGTAGLLNG